MTKSLDKTPIGTEGEPDSEQQAHLAGVPDSLPLTWCFKCAADVQPVGKGKCPRCGRILKNSFLARRHPINKLRVEQILDKLAAEYRPTTTMQQATCEHLAGTLEQLETLKPGSQEWQRSTLLAQQLGAKLEESRPAAPASTDLADLTDDQMIAKLTDLLRRALELQASPPRLPPLGQDGQPSNPEDAPTQAGGVTKPTDQNAVPGSVPAVVPLPEPARCPFCGQQPCIGSEHPAFEVLHWLDPEEVTRRAKAATAEMIESIRRQRR